MRILQVTNIISHHQLPFARELVSIVGAQNFRFAVTESMDSERIKLGWRDDCSEPWILRTAENAKDKVTFEQWWDQADLVICGERRFARMQDRVSKGKLTFYMSERWWKPPIGIARIISPRFAKMVFLFRKLSKFDFFHYLAVGPYAAKDIATLARLDYRIWRWGYFPQLPNPLPSLKRTTFGLRVLWVGRMLDLKRVDTLIKAFSEFHRDWPTSTLTLVGDGPERKRLVAMASNLLASESFQIIDPVPAADVLKIMVCHDVYVLPSSSYEGWGAVVNEAMGAGCVVLASKSAGAAAAMIHNGVNGYLFSTGNWRELLEHLKTIARNDDGRLELAKNGQETVSRLWSPKVAATRLVEVAAALHSGCPWPVYPTGPMSKAQE